MNDTSEQSLVGKERGFELLMFDSETSGHCVTAQA